MAKAMKVPVLVFESTEDAEIILESIGLYEKQGIYNSNKTKVKEIRNEIRKILIIFEKTNNN